MHEMIQISVIIIACLYLFLSLVFERWHPIINKLRKKVSTLGHEFTVITRPPPDPERCRLEAKLILGEEPKFRYSWVFNGACFFGGLVAPSICAVPGLNLESSIYWMIPVCVVFGAIVGLVSGLVLYKRETSRYRKDFKRLFDSCMERRAG